MTRIFFLGPFPPPLTGMAAINQAALERIQSQGLDIVKLDTSPASLKRDIFSRLSRLRRITRAWSQLLKAQKHQDLLYISISGRWGQVYDIVSLVIARLRRIRCYVHHHNFTYLRYKWFSTGLLLFVAGHGATHVVLCAEMGRRLQYIYGVQRIMTLSNLAFLKPDVRMQSRTKVHVVGFLSNITIEKGIESIFALAYAIRDKKWKVNMIVAGPCYNKTLIKKLHRAEEEGVLEWIGGVYGKDKSRFWKEIDAFIFPTKLEAEPLVVWEALAAGVPVIANDRGCIRGQVGLSGSVVPKEMDFVGTALEIMAEWIVNSSEYRSNMTKTQEQFRSTCERAETQWLSLLESFSLEIE